MIHSGLMQLVIVGMLPSLPVLVLATYLTRVTKRTVEIRRVSPER